MFPTLTATDNVYPENTFIYAAQNIYPKNWSYFIVTTCDKPRIIFSAK